MFHVKQFYRKDVLFIGRLIEAISAAMTMLTGTFPAIANWWVVLYAVAMFTVTTAIGIIGTIVNRKARKGGRRR